VSKLSSTKDLKQVSAQAGTKSVISVERLMVAAAAVVVAVVGVADVD
jgi:hypothetical protein